MVYEGMETVVCDAEENDWLDVSYSERKYVQKKQMPRKDARKKVQVKFSRKALKILLVVALCVAAFAAMMFIDGNFTKDVFGAIKTAYSSVIFGGTEPQPVEAKIALPCNVNLVEVSADGVATFNGGRAVMSFTAGKVVNASEDSVTIAMNDDTCIVYEGLSEVYVALNDTVNANTLLGKYDGSFTATISVSGQTVKEVVGSETQLTWNV